jgi:rhomboid-like protein
LGPAEVVKIFGPSLSTADANRLLHILHGRRVAGTLEDPELRVNTAMFGPKHTNAALEWLRQAVPVDEITNAGLRAEDELAVLEGGVEEEGQEENAEEQKPSGGWLKGKLFKDAPSNDDIYGPSVFDAIRAKNIARHEELLRKQKEAEEAKRLEEEAAFQSGELQTIGQRTLGQVRPPPSPQMQKWIDNATSDLEAPPDMSKTQRILPSAVVALLVSSLFVAFAYYYRPPRRSERLWPDIPPAAATVGLLCLANVAVYLAWKAPPLWGVLNRYFVLTPATPRPLQLFGAMFSHQVFAHALVNLVTLWVLGTRFHDEVGRGEFLATYASAGAVSFLGSLTAIVLRNRLDLTTLGASGAVYGVAAAYFWLHRFEGFKPFGVIPEAYKGVPGVAFIGLAIGLNIAAALSPATRMDVAAHLVGLAVGVLAAHLIEMKRGLAKGVEGKKPAEAAAVVAAAGPSPLQKAK